MSTNDAARNVFEAIIIIIIIIIFVIIIVIVVVIIIITIVVIVVIVVVIIIIIIIIIRRSCCLSNPSCFVLLSCPDPYSRLVPFFLEGPPSSRPRSYPPSSTL